MTKPKPPGYRPPFRRRPGSKQGPYDGYVRVRLPKTNLGELIGVIEENYGSKLLVKCTDGYSRVCRIPGKIRYKVRVRMGDVVLVKKWTVQENEKGDYLYRYSPAQISQLMKRGFLKEEDRQV